jgi:hypothetical protein
MKISRLTAIYTAVGLAALLAGLVVVLLLRSKPVADNRRSAGDAARATEHHRLAPSLGNTGNHVASNANAINRSQGGPSSVSPTPIVYPTLAPVEPMSQTVGGYTVTLYPLYADANRIALTYTVQSVYPLPGKLSMCEPLPGQDPFCPDHPPAGMSPSPLPTREAYRPQLTGAGGEDFPWVEVPPRQAAQLGTPIGSLLMFDSQLSPDRLPAELKLHLTLNTVRIQVPQDDGVAITGQVKGPFTFDFSLPVDPVRRIAEVNQTLTTDLGDKITLNRVIATRHHVRISWRLEYATRPGVTSGPGRFYYACCSLQLEAGSKSVRFTARQGPSWSGYDIAEVEEAPVLGEQGEWRITTSYYSTWTGNMFYPDLLGPAFHFTMPPAITSLQP